MKGKLPDSIFRHKHLKVLGIEGVVTHSRVILAVFEVVTSRSNARLLYRFSFKLPICKLSKTQSNMCLNTPVVLLCQGADPDSDPWHSRPQAAGGKY